MKAELEIRRILKMVNHMESVGFEGKELVFVVQPNHKIKDTIKLYLKHKEIEIKRIAFDPPNNEAYLVTKESYEDLQKKSDTLRD